MDHGAALFPGSIMSSYAARRSHLLLYSFHFVSEESECVEVEFAFPNRNKRSAKNRCTFKLFPFHPCSVPCAVLPYIFFSFPLQPLLSVLVYIFLSRFFLHSLFFQSPGLSRKVTALCNSTHTTNERTKPQLIPSSFRAGAALPTPASATSTSATTKRRT